jgi:hypothetical protein
MRRSLAAALTLLVLAALLVAGRAGAQTPPVPPAPVQSAPPPDAKEEARSHFELGLFHFDRAEWSAALAEFLRARELYPTRSATKNAAICLHKESRFDEALDLFEELERDYPDLSATDRALADREIAELRREVGALTVAGAEPGASIGVDGRARGTAPLAAPLRLSVGGHVVRVFKEGFVPFEEHVDVASGQATRLDVRMAALTRSGRLRVVEQTGKVLDVLLDNTVVGKTPWEGSVAPGDHSLQLRGEGGTGTPPVAAPVAEAVETPIALVAVLLDAALRVEPRPGGALVAVDGVPVGRGVWEGRLPSGPHRIEVSARGYWLATRDATLGAQDRQVLSIVLERDPTSPVWGQKARPRFAIALDGAFVVTPVDGGQVQSACSGACSGPLPVGGLGVVTATYQLPQGLGVGIEAGYLGFVQTLTHRSAQIVGSTLRASDAGTLDDRVAASGLLLGAALGYRMGDAWPLTLRLAAGAYVASVTDQREGLFRTSAQGQPADAPYAVGLSESHTAAFFYAAPEVRIARRLGERFEVDAGLKLLVLATPSPPAWTDQRSVLAGPAGTQGDGLGKFGTQTLTSSILVVLAPGIGARLEL